MSDLNKPNDEDLNKLNGYERVKAIAEYILRAKGKSSENKTLPGPRILRYAKEEFPKANIVDNTFVAYLQRGGSDENSNLATQGRRQGYYISNFVEEVAREDEIADGGLDTSNATAQIRTKYEREKLLYPVLVSWVQDQGYRAKDTSSLRDAAELARERIVFLNA